MDDDSLYAEMQNYIAQLEYDVRTVKEERNTLSVKVGLLESRIAEQGRLLSILTEQLEAGFVH